MFKKMLFLFCIGSMGGWILELLYRRIMNKNKKWINPGFLVGPYLPLYGFGLNVLFLIAECEHYIPISNIVAQKISAVLLMGIAATLLEYITGLIFVKRMNVKLWDYSKEYGNIQGIICPLYSAFWTILCAVYYLLFHYRLAALLGLAAANDNCIFFLGIFYGVFIVDLFYSSHIIIKVRSYARTHSIIVKLEEWKQNIIALSDERMKRKSFLFILPSPGNVRESLFHFLKENMNEIPAGDTKQHNILGGIYTMYKINHNTSNLLTCISEILIGILLLIDPVGFTSSIIVVFGIILTILGISNLFSYFRNDVEIASQQSSLAKGLVFGVFGLFCVLKSEWFIATFPILTILYGILTLVVGIGKVQWL